MLTVIRSVVRSYLQDNLTARKSYWPFSLNGQQGGNDTLGYKLCNVSSERTRASPLLVSVIDASIYMSIYPSVYLYSFLSLPFSYVHTTRLMARFDSRASVNVP